MEIKYLHHFAWNKSNHTQYNQIQKIKINLYACIHFIGFRKIIKIIEPAHFSKAALIGVLMLTGIVVTNGIVLIDKIERNRKGGVV
ncbi:hypothetical protein QNK12_19190 [Neobacillus cucumis]|nr:hypothetical protein QNK12_19190 [Neobacillus cucumis]